MSVDLKAPIVQLCPSDIAPFATLCQSVERAAQRLGRPCHTAFLRPTTGVAQRLAEATYLDLDAPEDYDVSGPAVAAWVHEQIGSREPALVLAQRYRSYRVARAAGLPNHRTVTVAHEFGMLRRLRRRLDRRLRGRDVRFAGVSDAVASDLAKVTGDRWLLINAVDVTGLRDRLESRARARVRLGLADRRFAVGVVGRLTAIKRPALALEAFRQFAEPESELLFLGTGDAELDLKRAAGDSSARFLGYVPDAAILFPGLDAVLIPTGAREAFGLIALEAMVAGVPVVSAPSPGVQFVTGELGFFAASDRAEDLSAALAQAYALTSAEQERWRTAAFDRAQRLFGVPALARQLESLVRTAPDPQDR
ncbi:MAG: glycosyltransferase family 4 protein [Pseudomonadota bacterium]